MFPGANHFKREEWQHDPDRVSPVLVATLDAVRDATGRPGTKIRINQAWDPEGHVGDSGHGDDPATAVDFVFLGLTFAQQLAFLDAEPRFTGIGFYPDWNTPGWHGDIKARPARKFWICRNGAYTYYDTAASLAQAMGWTSPVQSAPPPIPLAAPAEICLPIIRAKASAFDLPPELVRAMVEQESTFQAYRNRFEQGFYDRYIRGKKLDFVPPLSLKITEALGRATSWGLLQVMGATAREQGFRGWFPELCQPDVGLEWGCRYLAFLRRQFGREGWPVVVRAYNGGPGGRANAANHYPDEVLEKLGGRWPDVPAA
ncbi:transglycosylase SLT domain-containing protein [Solidesulfovibrio sp.]